MNYKISIIIPTYKRATMLKRAVESCLNQSYKNIEVIVVDDNNPNSDYRKETSELMKSFAEDDRVKYVLMKKNSGGVQARNKGISEAIGEYIAFLDDDDYFLDGKIEKQLKYMLDNKLDACFTASETYDETKQKIVKVKRYKNFNNYDDLMKFHMVEMIVSTQTFMIKKSVLLSVKCFSEVPAGQEFYLMYKIIKKGFKVGYLDEVKSRICIHSGERITTGKKKIEAEKFLYNLKKSYFNQLNFSQKQRVKYIYKYNIWSKYKSSCSFKQYIWLLYIIISHPIIVMKRLVKHNG